MASNTYTQYRSSTGYSSTPETALNAFISNYHDYFSMRISQNESIMIIGDTSNGKDFKNCTVYIYDSNTRNITQTEYEKVNCNVYQSYYTRGSDYGIPVRPVYDWENSIGNLYFNYIILAVIPVCFLFKLINRFLHRR